MSDLIEIITELAIVTVFLALVLVMDYYYSLQRSNEDFTSISPQLLDRYSPTCSSYQPDAGEVHLQFRRQFNISIRLEDEEYADDLSRRLLTTGEWRSNRWRMMLLAKRTALASDSHRRSGASGCGWERRLERHQQRDRQRAISWMKSVEDRARRVRVLGSGIDRARAVRDWQVFAESEAMGIQEEECAREGIFVQRYYEKPSYDDGCELQSSGLGLKVVGEDGVDEVAEPMTGSVHPPSAALDNRPGMQDAAPEEGPNGGDITFLGHGRGDINASSYDDSNPDPQIQPNEHAQENNDDERKTHQFAVEAGCSRGAAIFYLACAHGDIREALSLYHVIHGTIDSCPAPPAAGMSADGNTVVGGGPDNNDYDADDEAVIDVVEEREEDVDADDAEPEILRESADIPTLLEAGDVCAGPSETIHLANNEDEDWEFASAGSIDDDWTKIEGLTY